MKGQPVSDTDKKYILKNKNTKFYNQMASELGLSQKTVRKIAQSEL